MSRGKAWPVVVWSGGEACAAAQPAMGGWSRRYGGRRFGRLEQQDQRLKTQLGRWINIERSVQLESFID